MRRLQMRKIAEALRLRAAGLTTRKIAASLNVGQSTISEYLKRAERAGLSWPLPEGIDETALERRLFAPVGGTRRRGLVPPDWAAVHQALRRKGVTLSLIWEDYRAAHPGDGYGYSRFCDLYRRWEGRLRHVGASIEDVDYRTPRQLDRDLFRQLALGDWIGKRQNLIITGPCGVGKTWLACALGQKACRDGRTVLYHRLPRLFADLELAHGDGRFPKLFRQLVRTDLLILDDWGPDRLTSAQRRDLMEIVEGRYGHGSILITSQLPVDAWHEFIGEPTFADAILDRLVHNAHRLPLDGPSMRKNET